MKTVKLYVEGGGESNQLHSECRAAFRSFLEKAGLSGHMPRIVASGSRNDAFGDYFTAIMNGEKAFLLIDSEGPVMVPQDGVGYNDQDLITWKPWYHLSHRRGKGNEVADNWKQIQNPVDEECHLMVQSMESWFLADVNALKSYYGKGFNENSLPKNKNIESIGKEEVISSLKKSSEHTKKGIYSKGNHSFEILASISPEKVMSQSLWAKRFIDLLSKKMHGDL